MKKILIFSITSLLIISGCKKEYYKPDIQTAGTGISKNMIIDNDPATLNQRITYVNNVPSYVFNESGVAKDLGDNGSKGASVTLNLIAALYPPTYNGETLQASHVRLIGNYAYVAYNTQGSRYLGGVDVVDVSSPCNPVLVSSVVFINQETNQGIDVSSVEAYEPASGEGNTRVWITGADETTDSAFVEQFELNSMHQFESDQTLKFNLPGYVGTDVRYFDNKIFVSSGNNGGLTVLDDQMTQISYMDINNARSVDINPDYEIVLGGNPGHLYNPGVWDNEIGGAMNEEAKSIVRLHNQFALVALGEEGVKSYDLSTATPPTPVSSLPAPVVPAGATASDYVSNGVSVSDNGWVYIADGAGGLDVAKMDSNGNLTWLGNINVGASANYVEANKEYVFVARGVLGLKIIKVTEH